MQEWADLHQKVLNKTLSGRLRELKNKRKVQLGNPKSGRGRLRELIITNKSQFKWGFTTVVVTRPSTVILHIILNLIQQ